MKFKIDICGDKILWLSVRVDKVDTTTVKGISW